MDIKAVTARLRAWNEGDTEAVPSIYTPDALDFQIDLRAALRAADAASDLLAALKEMLSPWEGFSEGELKRRCHMGLIGGPKLVRIFAARAAIAKATGA